MCPCPGGALSEIFGTNVQRMTQNLGQKDLTVLENKVRVIYLLQKLQSKRSDSLKHQVKKIFINTSKMHQKDLIHKNIVSKLVFIKTSKCCPKKSDSRKHDVKNVELPKHLVLRSLSTLENEVNMV